MRHRTVSQAATDTDKVVGLAHSLQQPACACSMQAVNEFSSRVTVARHCADCERLTTCRCRVGKLCTGACGTAIALSSGVVLSPRIGLGSCDRSGDDSWPSTCRYLKEDNNLESLSPQKAKELTDNDKAVIVDVRPG